MKCLVLSIFVLACSSPAPATTPCPAPIDDAATVDAGSEEASVEEAGQACDDPSLPAVSKDPGYRVVVENVKGSTLTFPSSSTSWQLAYQMTVPPLPCSSTWNHKTQTFYVWGDVDFDDYGSSGTYPLHHYLFNQIVPQIMIGNALAANDASFKPTWSLFDHWVIQAQYYWQDQNGTSYALVGSALPVSPGDVVTIEIDYFASSGSITAQISAKGQTSSIKIARPFPNEATPLYATWKDFFAAAEAASGEKLLGNPVVNVESHYVDQATVCSTLPLNEAWFSVPGTFTSSQLQVVSQGGLTCAGGNLATLEF